MAQDITQTQANFVARYQSAISALMNAMNALDDLKAEWDAHGYATGAAAVGGTNWNIGDVQVQAAIPGATAAMLNSAVGAVVSINTTYQSNLGYLIVLRP